MEEYVVIVAGGSGSRMRSTTPKQFLELAGKPILMHSIEAFHNHSEKINIILALPQDAIKYWNEVVEKHNFSIAHKIVEGGISRFHSVKNGLNEIENQESLVAIHDGVRPLVSVDIIANAFDVAKAKGSAIVATLPKDSIRIVDGDETTNIDRSSLRIIQTPQTFNTAIIKEAYNHFEDHTLFTDDASVAEKYGHAVSLVSGSYENIKITTPEDLLYAEVVLEQKRKATR